MSSSAPRPGERVIHQDFIARIRFSNALPPPPNPPKLLDIPNTGLASGQYTTPGFASRLAREQPLNIEIDAELGMPLDLVGMPGVFDGDESSIQPPATQPSVHPHDRALLRPISALGKPKVAESNVSFLRRTEYISSIAPAKEKKAPQALLRKVPRPRRAPEAAADSPVTIKRKIDKSFELAEQYLKDPKRLKHPSKKNLRLVDARPLLPDLDSLPDSGTYVSVRFNTKPVHSGDTYDSRLLSGIFRPIDRTEAEEEAFNAAMEAYEYDPVNNSKPQNLMNYEYYLGESQVASKNFKRMMNPEDDERENEELYTHATGTSGCFNFQKLRAYETVEETELTNQTKFDLEVLLANNDEDAYPRQKATYYYPIMQKVRIQPQRRKNINKTTGVDDDDADVIHQLDVIVQDPTEAGISQMKHYKENPLTDIFEEEEHDDQGHHEDEQHAEAENPQSPIEQDLEAEDEE